MRRIVDYLRERVWEADKSCSVSIGFSTTYGWVGEVEVETGALLRTGHGHVYGMEPIDTLVRLLDELDACVDKYLERHKPKEADDGRENAAQQ